MSYEMESPSPDCNGNPFFALTNGKKRLQWKAGNSSKFIF